MKVLITGGRGFIGANMVKYMLTKKWEVCVIDTNNHSSFDVGHVLPPVDIEGRCLISVTDLDKLDAHIGALMPDVVIHLAAKAIVSDVEKSPLPAYETNIMGTLNVLECCRKHGTPVIVASSDKAYGNSTPPFKEEDPLRPVYPYDISKAVQDLMAQSYALTYRMPVVVTRCVNVYGPGDLNWSRLVPHTVRAALRGERPQNHRAMWWIKREWVYVEDAVEAYAFLAKQLVKLKTRGVFNIGSGQIASPSEIVPKIISLAGAHVEPDLVERNFQELHDEFVDSSRINSLGWKPKIGLEEGLTKTIEWYRNYLPCRAFIGYGEVY